MSLPEHPFPTRASRLAELAEETDLDALLVTDPVSIEYLTGFTGTNAACLVGPGIRLFLTDPRYREWVAGGLGEWEVEVLQGQWVPALARKLPARTGIEDGHVTVRFRSGLESGAPGGVDLVAAGGLVEGLRRAKDDGEIARIAAAAELADSILGEVLEKGLAGKSEASVAGTIVGRLREEGAEPSFPPIVASGPNSASPHAEPGSRVIGDSEVVILDLGAKLDGYCSDCTRTVCTGSVEDRILEVHGVVERANLAALDQAAAGIGCSALDEVARGEVERAGYGPAFSHGLGHGVGLEIHEAPRLGPKSDETLIEGDVVTIEPGVYLSGEFGVRIEDMVSIGPEGIARNFASHPRELLQVG